MIAAANGQQISMTDSLNVRELQHLFKQWAQPPFTLPLNSQRDQPSRQEMKRVALAESDKEGEGEIKQKTTKKYKERTYSKRSLNLSEEFITWKHIKTFAVALCKILQQLQGQAASTNKRGSTMRRQRSTANSQPETPRGRASTHLKCSSTTDLNEPVQFTPTKDPSKCADGS